MNFKFISVLFCRLFSFNIFQARLEHVSKFSRFNFLVFLSAPHTLGEIAVAAYVAYQNSGALTQLYLQSIDLIIVAIFTCIFGIANTHKD